MPYRHPWGACASDKPRLSHPSPNHRSRGRPHRPAKVGRSREATCGRPRRRIGLRDGPSRGLTPAWWSPASWPSSSMNSVAVASARLPLRRSRSRRWTRSSLLRVRSSCGRRRGGASRSWAPWRVRTAASCVVAYRMQCIQLVSRFALNDEVSGKFRLDMNKVRQKVVM